jgi:uncharacterized protein
VEEVLIVLALSLLASAVFAILDLLSAPVRRSVVVAVFANVDLARQVTSIVFALAPVALVVHLIRRGGERFEDFGMDRDHLAADAGWGAVAAAGIGLAGLGLYLGALALDINRSVIPVPPLGHWWTVPILILGSAKSALLEEVIVVGYLIRRLGQLGWGALAVVATSALLRGGYHLYQGWGGFLGNVLLGAIFGLAFLRWRRIWPLVVAHFLLDTSAGVAYIAFRGHCFWGVCIP